MQREPRRISLVARDAAVLHHLDRSGRGVRHPMPGLDPADPGFQMLRYRRGPWAVVANMIGRAGFHEAFDPADGAPTGGDACSWTAAIRLARARE